MLQYCKPVQPVKDPWCCYLQKHFSFSMSASSFRTLSLCQASVDPTAEWNLGIQRHPCSLLQKEKENICKSEEIRIINSYEESITFTSKEDALNYLSFLMEQWILQQPLLQIYIHLIGTKWTSRQCNICGIYDQYYPWPENVNVPWAGMCGRLVRRLLSCTPGQKQWWQPPLGTCVFTV